MAVKEDPSAPSAVVIAIDRARKSKDPPTVEERISGTWVLPTDQVQQILGPTTWKVWRYLARNRDRAGQTHAANTTLAKHLELSLFQIKRACRRLRRAGMLVLVRWKHSRGTHNNKARVRVVLGDYRRGRFTVPKSVIMPLTKLPQNGGTRSGAGRTPKGVAFERAQMKIAIEKAIKIGPPKHTFEGHFLAKKIAEEGVEAGNQIAPHSIQIAPHSVTRSLPTLLPKKIKAPKTSRGYEGSKESYNDLIVKEQCLRSSEEDLKHSPAKRTGEGSLFLEEKSKTRDQHVKKNSSAQKQQSILDGTGKKKARECDVDHTLKVASVETLPPKPTEDDLNQIAKWLREGGEIFPRFPSRVDIHAAILPSPPMIKESASPIDAVWHLIKSYRGAVERIYKQPCFIFAKSDITRSKYYDLLIEAQQVMRDLEIAPAGWVLFSFDAWREISKSNKTKPPPINYVFGARRIMERRGWYAREESSYAGRRVLFSSEALDMGARLDALRQLKIRTLEKLEKKYGYVPRDETKIALQALVEQEFPGGFQPWFERVRAIGDEQTAELKKLVDAGEFVWG